MSDNLKQQFNKQVGTIGLGYVGLPLAILCVIKGFNVIGFEKDNNKLNLLNHGKSYISDISDLMVETSIKNNLLYPTQDFSLISKCDIVIVCVPTPLAGDNTPNYSYLFDAMESIAQNMKQGQLVMTESTIVPTTSRNEIIPILQKKGFIAGKDFHFSFSPERIDPGNDKFKIDTIPKLVSGYTDECRELAADFYTQLGLKVHKVASLEVAEMAKILENTYRDVNIALANELAQVCKLSGISIWDVIEAAATKPFGFSAFYPGPGVGGHCIPKDCTFYTYLADKYGTRAKLAECAREINNNMPHYIISRLETLLTNSGKCINGSNLLILGVTYKKDVNDIRESPAIEIIKKLSDMGAHIEYHDPYIKTLDVQNIKFSSIQYEDILKSKADCILLAVGHSCYKGLDFSDVSLLFNATNNSVGSLNNTEIL